MQIVVIDVSRVNMTGLNTNRIPLHRLVQSSRPKFDDMPQLEMTFNPSREIFLFNSSNAKLRVFQKLPRVKKKSLCFCTRFMLLLPNLH